jgi:hypothetical protein
MLPLQPWKYPRCSHICLLSLTGTSEHLLDWRIFAQGFALCGLAGLLLLSHNYQSMPF